MKPVFETPHGHVVLMPDGSAMCTSPAVANDMANISATLLTAMTQDMAKLIGLTTEEIIQDYYEELEIDMVHAAINAVLRKQGHESSIFPTRTRVIINEKIKMQEEKEDA